jgi:hypothetical protein
MAEKNFFGQNPLFKRVFSVAFALFLVLGALAFMGCPTEGDDPPPPVQLESDSPLVGTWEFTSAGYTDAYKITADTVQYGLNAGNAFTPTFIAKIHEVQYFTDEKTSGMLYIEYTTKKPQYFSGSYATEPPYAFTQTGGPFDPPGNFIVVMFHDLNTTNNTIKLANPYNTSDTHSGKGNDGSNVTYIASEVPTLAAAKDKFNIDTESSYVAWSNVSAQTKVNP